MRSRAGLRNLAGILLSIMLLSSVVLNQTPTTPTAPSQTETLLAGSFDMKGCTNMFISRSVVNPTNQSFMMVGSDDRLASVTFLPSNTVSDISNTGITSSYFYGACTHSIQGCMLYYDDSIKMKFTDLNNIQGTNYFPNYSHNTNHHFVHIRATTCGGYFIAASGSDHHMASPTPAMMRFPIHDSDRNVFSYTVGKLVSDL